MPAKLPRRLARINRVVTNPIQGQWAWLLPPWAVICHRGRRSGRVYRTPVLAFKLGPQTLAIVVLYGEESDWIRNLVAGGGRLVRLGRTYEVTAAWVRDADAVEGMAPLGRWLGRFSGRVLVASLGAAASGFGRGPAAG